MNNFKKIGLTALAASLVSVSANAGALTASGGASMTAEGYSGVGMNGGTGFTMGNSVTLAGSGETDGGITVSISYELDNGAANGTKSPFDNHSLSVSSDSLGTLKISGHGGSSAASALDTTAAGDIWDTFDAARANGVIGVAVTDSSPGDNGIFYTLPSMMDDLTLNVSYNPQASTARTADSELGYSATYSGVDGLTASYGVTDVETGATGTSGDQTAWKLAYAYGPVTATASSTDYDVGTGSNDQTMTSMAVSYTVTDDFSLTYGTEEIEKGGDPTDAEYSIMKAAFTTGGMTITATMKDGENINHTTATNEDMEYWSLGASFAF